RVTLEAGRIFHSSGDWGRRCRSRPSVQRTCLRLACLRLACLCLVCLCFVCAGSLGRLCALVPSGVESHGRPRRGVGEICRFVTAVGAAEDPAVMESVLLALPEFDLEDM